MCSDCWASEYGSPAEWTAQTARFLELHRELYRELDCSTGGPLHIVLDDWNIEDDSLAWCRENLPADLEWYEDALRADIERVCLELLDIMDGWTLAQRASALAFEEGAVPKPQVVR